MHFSAIVAEGYRLLRIDTLDNRSISDKIVEQLKHQIADTKTQAVAFCDFRHGIFNRVTIPQLTGAIPKDVFRVADSQVASRWGNILEFQGFDLITPNEREARFALGDQDSVVLKADCTVSGIIKNNSLVDEVHEGEEVEVVLDATPFYAESGGQISDRGTIKADNVKVEVRHTKKISDIVLHTGTVKKGTLRNGMAVHASVEEERTKAVMRNHTATHLLQAALREVLGDHIKQAGSLVAHDRLRFDFTHFFALDDHEINEVEAIVNEKIIGNLPVEVKETSLDDAVSKGVTALFGEKYGNELSGK